MKQSPVAVAASALLTGYVLHTIFWFLPFVVTVPLFLGHALRTPGMVILPLALLAALLPGGSLLTAGAVLLPLGVRRLPWTPRIDFSFTYALTLLVSTLAACVLLISPPALRLWRSGAMLGDVLRHTVPLGELAAVVIATSVTVFIASIVVHFNWRTDD